MIEDEKKKWFVAVRESGDEHFSLSNYQIATNYAHSHMLRKLLRKKLFYIKINPGNGKPSPKMQKESQVSITGLP